jgi:membrane protease YdiL (CAAX protease family)
MDILIASVIVIIATISIFRINAITKWIRIKFSSDSYLDSHLKYQICLLILAGIVLELSYFQNPDNFISLFSVGNLSAPAEPVSWFGITAGHTWVFAGLYLLVLITTGTAIFVFLQFRSLKLSLSEILPYMGWIILFSLMNSFSEEAIYRLGIIAPALGSIDVATIALVSAVLFGVAHFGGMPNGLIGMFMAGFLGWFLAKAVMETEGLFWAWTIHFVQDIVIYIGFMANRAVQAPHRQSGEKLGSDHRFD